MYGKRKGVGAFDIQTTCLPMKSHHHFYTILFLRSIALVYQRNILLSREQDVKFAGLQPASYSAKTIYRNTLARTCGGLQPTGAPQPSLRHLQMNQPHHISTLRLPCCYLAKLSSQRPPYGTMVGV